MFFVMVAEREFPPELKPSYLTGTLGGRIETAERRARSNATMVPSLVILIEGNSMPDVQGAFDALVSGAAAFDARSADTALYRLEFTRLKTPWCAG